MGGADSVRMRVRWERRGTPLTGQRTCYADWLLGLCLLYLLYPKVLRKEGCWQAACWREEKTVELYGAPRKSRDWMGQAEVYERGDTTEDFSRLRQEAQGAGAASGF